MAQACSLLVFKYTEKRKKGRHILYLTGIKNAKFRKIVKPNDYLRIHVEITKCKALTFWESKGEITVDGELACEALMTSMLAKVQ